MIISRKAPMFHEEKPIVRDEGTCKNCKYQGEGLPKCENCVRGTRVKIWGNVKNPIDNFKLV